MNPLKMLNKTIPDLAKVIESIHAHLELQLEEQKKINNYLQTMNVKFQAMNEKLDALIKK